MGGASHLPHPQAVGVGLAGGVVVQDAEHIGLGLHDDRRHVEVGAQQGGRAEDGRGDVDAAIGRAERRTRPATAVDQEPVEGVGQGLHTVRVGRQRERRLRFADGEHTIDLEAVGRRPRRAVAAEGAADLGEDVVGVRVAGVAERAVPLRIDRPDSLAGTGVDAERDGHRNVAALDADALRRHPRPRVPLPHELVGEVGVVGGGIGTARHVQPLDDQGAVERGVGGRASHDDSCRVRRAGRGAQRQHAVGRQLAVLGVGRGRTRRRELGLGVAGGGEIGTGARRQEEAAVASGQRRERRGRTVGADPLRSGRARRRRRGRGSIGRRVVGGRVSGRVVGACRDQEHPGGAQDEHRGDRTAASSADGRSCGCDPPKLAVVPRPDRSPSV